MKRITFVYPVFNEAPNLKRVFSQIEKVRSWLAAEQWKPEFLFINDGSTDETESIIRAHLTPGVRLITLPTNQGPGAAFQTAFSHILKNHLSPDDFVVTLEGDSTSDPKVLMRMLKRTEEGDDIILASPYLYGGGFDQVRWHRVLLSHVANALIKLLLDIRGLATFSCFFRIYRGTSLLKLAKIYGPDSIITMPGFECAVEVAVKAVRCQLKISEVPFFVDWTARAGKSKMKIFRTMVGYARLFTKIYTGHFKRQEASASTEPETEPKRTAAL